jgi:hypothetical protein
LNIDSNFEFRHSNLPPLRAKLDQALFTLLRLHGRAFLRRTTRGARSPRGFVYFLVGLSVAALWLGPRIFWGIRHPMNDPTQMREMFPLVLLSICVLTLLTNGGGRAFYFTPAEVDFLFPGPFPRKQVLLYKIAKSALAATIGSLVFSCFMLSRVYHWFAGYVAIVLAMIFLQLFSMTLVLLSQTIAERAFTRGRKLLLALIVVAAAALVYESTNTGSPLTKEAILGWIRASRPAQIALAPFAVFGQVATSRRLSIDLPIWALGAIAVDGLLLFVVLWLDADYLESAAASSERAYARRMRGRRGQGFTSGAIPTGIRLPLPPRLAGIGPLAWRQLTGAARTARTTLIILGLATFFAAPFIHRFLQTDALPPVLGIAGWLTLFTTNLLRFDFRGDLEQMDTLKALPLRAWSMVVGQVTAPVTILSSLHLLLLAGLSIVEPQHRTIAASIAMIVIPLNLLFSLIENLIFLVFPVRELNVSPGDLQGTGRRMIVLVLKLLGVIFVGGIATAIAAVVYAFTDHSLPLACVSAAFVLLIADTAMVPVLGFAFVRFDPSIDTPA